mgnify:CR=1 FL=1
MSSRYPNKYVIGLTGNIAVGKSAVRQMLQHLGAYTVDADSMAHQTMSLLLVLLLVHTTELLQQILMVTIHLYQILNYIVM